MKTKKEIVQGLIEANQEEIFRLEVVRDFNLASDHKEAKVQVDAANSQIKKNEVQVTWLKDHLKSLG